MLFFFEVVFGLHFTHFFLLFCSVRENYLFPFLIYQKRVFQFCKKNTKKKNWTILVSFLEHFWEQFWGPFWDQIGQRGGKMSPREPSGASKSQKAAFSKTLKNLKFFSVFGCRGLPRELQEAREGSQETPKETPKGGPKLGQKVVKK